MADTENDILIYRDIPVIAGYVQVAPNLESEKTKTNAATAISRLEAQMAYTLDPQKTMLLGSGQVTQHGVMKGKQNYIRLPGINSSEGYVDKSGNSINPSDILRE